MLYTFQPVINRVEEFLLFALLTRLNNRRTARRLLVEISLSQRSTPDESPRLRVFCVLGWGKCTPPSDLRTQSQADLVPISDSRLASSIFLRRPRPGGKLLSSLHGPWETV